MILSFRVMLLEPTYVKDNRTPYDSDHQNDVIHSITDRTYIYVYFTITIEKRAYKWQ